LTFLERLTITQEVWLQHDLSAEEAREILKMQPIGCFLVRGRDSDRRKVLSVHVKCDSEKSSRIQDYNIAEENSVFHLEESWLEFVDIFQLIAFYSMCRDILPCRLHLPDAFLQLPSRAELEAVTALGMKFWTSGLHRQKQGLTPTAGDQGVSEPDLGARCFRTRPMCSIQVTSENGALCFINPLFLREHGDSWLTQAPALQLANRNRARSIQLSSGRSLETDSVMIRKQVSIYIPGRPLFSMQDNLLTKGTNKSDVNDEQESQQTVTLRKKSSPCLSACSLSEDRNPELSERKGFEKQGSVQEEGKGVEKKEMQVVQSPHRASWIEWTGPARPWELTKSRSETSLCSCESSLLPPISEQDSLSISSMEDEGDTFTAAATSSKKRNSGAFSDKVRHRLSAVGNVFSGLLSTEKRVQNKVNELSQVSDSYFGGLVQSFISHTLKNSSKHPTSVEMLQEIRQMTTNLKSYLLEGSELHSVIEHADPDFNLDSTIEVALHKCVLKPLRVHIYSHLQDFHARDGSAKLLQENQQTMKGYSLSKLGVTASVPDVVAMEKIQQKFSLMHTAYSPKKKVNQLLKACKLIYEAMTGASGKAYGADDFLPVLTYVLVSSDIMALQLDVEYMMELLDPTQLHGEGGYYLTTLFGALFHISTFQPKMVTRQISVEAQKSIHQWQRRRTLHGQAWRRTTQWMDGFCNFLHVSFLEPSANKKSISAPVSMTAKDVCKICSVKYQVQDPEQYGLFLVKEGENQLLEEDSCPQRIKGDL
uniref:Ras and Rab interactor like n=1 Tax=Latimeria chalumnae TaxID=7897 RepID=H3BE09_LATCH